MRIGCLTLITGMGLLALSLVASSLALLLIAGAVAGFGQGLSFRAGLTGVTAVTPAHQRGEVSSAYFVVAYIGIALPVIGVGVLAQITDLRTAGLLFCAVVAAIAMAAVLLISQPTARAEP